MTVSSNVKVGIPLATPPVLVKVKENSLLMLPSGTIPIICWVGASRRLPGVRPVPERAEIVVPPGLPETVRFADLTPPGALGVKRTSKVQLPAGASADAQV